MKQCPQCGYWDLPIIGTKPMTKEDYIEKINEYDLTPERKAQLLAAIHLCRPCGNFQFPSKEWEKQDLGICNMEMEIADPDTWSICGSFIG